MQYMKPDARKTERKELMILIDYKDRRPIYEQVVEKIADLIVRGILEQDSQLPSVRSLATDLAINPNTIQRAYAELERQGYIYSVRGRGSFVAENYPIREQKKRALFEALKRLVEEAGALGISMLEFQEQVIQDYGSLEGGRRDDRSGRTDETVF